MSRRLTPHSSLDTLKREAKRWLKALRAGDASAHARLRRANPAAPAYPGLRDVQHALAREHGFSGWTALTTAIAGESAGATGDAPIVALLDASARGDAARVSELLDAHPDIVSEPRLLPGHHGRRSALHFAVGGLHENVVRLLLDRGADPDVRDDGDNAMPLHFAAEKEHLGIIRLLVEHGADTIGSGDMHGLEVIGWATCFGSARADVVSYLLAHGAVHNIFSAVAVGDTAAVRAIVARSPHTLDRPMDRANNGRRPLHLAVIKKQPGALATLLQLGADVDAEDDTGMTALDQAALADERDMSDLLLRHGAQVQLPAAVALARDADVERLLRAEPGALAPGGRWATLIVRAAERAGGVVIERLIGAGASVNIADDPRTSIDSATGYTPLHGAAFFGNRDAAVVLMAHGADVRARDGRYCGTPAGWANHAGHRDVRDVILAGRIDLFEAVSWGLVERIAGIVRDDPAALEQRFGELASCEGKSWAPDASFTPLLWAAASGNVAAVRALLACGANPRARDARGRAALDVASSAQRADLAALL